MAIFYHQNMRVFSEIFILLLLLLPLSTGYVWNNMPLKKAGGKPNHGILQGWIPNNNSPFDNVKAKRKVDLSPKGNVGRFWIRQFNHAADVEDLMDQPSLSSWNSDPYGYDPMAPMTEFKK